MKCPNCSAENRYNATVCESCGISLLESPSDDTVDLDRFAPPHSDPIASPERGGSEQDTENGGSDFAQKAKAVLGKIGAFFVLAAKTAWKYLKALWELIKKGFTSAASWISGKIRGTENNSENTSRNASEEDESGEKFRKIILAVMLGLLAVILLISLSFCGACSSCSACSCASCGGSTLAGTWVEQNDTLNGYDATDKIFEFTEDGSVIFNGQNAGSYALTEDGLFTMDLNGMYFNADSVDSRADFIDIYLDNMPAAGQRLIKLSGETDLTAGEIADLYPDA